MPADSPFTESVKTRVPKDWRDKLERIARAEHLDLSDIVRRALVEFIERKARAKGR